MQITITTNLNHTNAILCGTHPGVHPILVDIDLLNEADRAALAELVDADGRTKGTITPPTTEGLLEQVRAKAVAMREDAVEREARVQLNNEVLAAARSYLLTANLADLVQKRKWALSGWEHIGSHSLLEILGYDLKPGYYMDHYALNAELGKATRAEIQRLNAEEEARKEQDAARKEAMEAEAQAERERVAEEWIGSHGSAHLRRLRDEGIECKAILRDEWLAHECPRWVWYNDTPGPASKEARNPPSEAIELLDDARVVRPEAELYYCSGGDESDSYYLAEDMVTVPGESVTRRIAFLGTAGPVMADDEPD
jgi:hypothetical protein